MTERESKFKNWQDLYDEMILLFPDGAIECDNHGQILVYTGLKVDPGDHTTLIDIVSEEEGHG